MDDRIVNCQRMDVRIVNCQRMDVRFVSPTEETRVKSTVLQRGDKNMDVRFVNC